MDISLSLRRKVVKRSTFDNLIEKSSCQSSFLGHGDTFLSIQLIAELAKKYHKQSQKWAEKLSKPTLKQTIESNYHFLYNHFQYQADGIEQQLKSPKCAWSTRFSGIDCKTFSLIASTLLLNQKISHYIRKIKQPGFHENEYTHVYVVVPIDQINNNLTKGYYIIDATTHDNLEPMFIEKHDIFMETMPHIGLNGANSTSKIANGVHAMHDLADILNQYGVKKCVTNAMLERLHSYVKQGDNPKIAIGKEGVVIEGMLFRFNQPGQNVRIPDIYIQTNSAGLNSANPQIDSGSSGSGAGINISDLLGDDFFQTVLDGIVSIFGAGPNSGFYKENHVAENISKLIDVYDNIVNRFNNAIANNNLTQTAQEVLRLKNTAEIVNQGFLKKKSEGWNNASESNLQASANFANKLQSEVNKAINSYLSAYTNPVSISQVSITFIQTDYSRDGNTGANISNMFGLYVGDPVSFDKSTTTGYKAKDNINIPAFELNENFYESVKPDKNLNTSSFLETLQNIIITATGGNTNPGSSNNGSGNPGTNTDETGTVDTSKSVLGSAAPFMIALGAGYLFRKPILKALNMNKKPKTTTKK
jgi:hypothetical protein